MKKAQVSIYLAFMISAIFIILIASIFAPMGVLFNTEMYKAGEDILERANTSIQGIHDATVKAQIESMVATAQDSAVMNIEVNADLFTYSWIIIVALTAIVVFLFSRRLNEVQGGLI